MTGNVLYLLVRFPNASNPFVFNQIAQAEDAGWRVSILARRAADAERMPELIRERGWAEVVRFLPLNERLLAWPCWSWPGARTAVQWLSWNATQRATRETGLRFAGPFTAGRYDLVHAQMGNLGVGAALMLRHGLLQGRLLVSIRGRDVTTVDADRLPLWRETFRIAERFLPVTVSLRDKLVAMGCPPEKCVVLPSPVRVELFPYRTPSPPEGRRLRLVSVGRLVEKKGHVHAIRAVRLLIDAGIACEYRIIGEGDLRPALESLVEELGLEGWVQIDPPMPQECLAAELHQADIFLMPSMTAANGDEEGLPNSLKEAMLCGLPCVATRHAGIPELVRDGENGLLVEEADAEGLAGAVRRLAEEPDLWVAMAERARVAVMAVADPDALGRKLLEIYEGRVASSM